MTGFLGGSLIGVGQGGDINTGDIEHSLRFRGAQTLTKTGITTGDRNYSTCSFFLKRAGIASNGLFTSYLNASNYFSGFINASHQLVLIQVEAGVTTLNRVSTDVFRDPMASGSFVIRHNGAQSVGSRASVEFNGVVIAMPGTETLTNGFLWGTSGYDLYIGRAVVAGTYLNGYLSRFCWTNGQSPSSSDFIEYNPTINEWVSKNQAEVKAVVDAGGANSFMLDFDDGTSLTTLGYDKSSKGNNWTLNGFSLTPGVTYDWMEDVPGNSFCTWNVLNKGTSISTSSGNILATGSGSTQGAILGTIALPNTGIWYAEFPIIAEDGSGLVGLARSDQNLTNYIGSTGNYGYGLYASNAIYSNGVLLQSPGSYTTGAFISAIFDATGGTGTLQFYKNDVAFGTLITGLDLSKQWLWATSKYTASETTGINCGQSPWTYPSRASSVDAVALCQANLPADGTAITSGTFTGNAAVDGPCVWMNGCPDTLTINGNAVTFGTHADRLATGFKLRTSSASYNTAGSNTWTATISSDLENIFKYNNAKDNS